MAKPVPGGYNGKILRVNLSDNSISTESMDEQFYRQYLGGAGFVSYFLLNELRQGIDPLGTENKLVFALGPVTGIPLPGGGRNSIGAQSPLTGGIAISEVGEFWGAQLKRAGYDAVIVEGKADKPVYLWIDDEHAELRDATHLWGKDAWVTQRMIRDEVNDPDIQALKIGPAGENMCYSACVTGNLGRAAGRLSVAAVWGSKNLKAVAVRGNRWVSVAKPKEFVELCQA